jgi:putative Holliday junction resolvase
MRILAIDPGDKRIGLAITDPTGTIATPLQVLLHVSREQDAQTIKELATRNQVVLVVIGVALDEDGGDTPSSRKARRLGDTLASILDVKIIYEDEAGSTREARETALTAGFRQRERKGHLDQMAAAILLQRYLDKVDR